MGIKKINMIFLLCNIILITKLDASAGGNISPATAVGCNNVEQSSQCTNGPKTTNAVSDTTVNNINNSYNNISNNQVQTITSTQIKIGTITTQGTSAAALPQAQAAVTGVAQMAGSELSSLQNMGIPGVSGLPPMPGTAQPPAAPGIEAAQNLPAQMPSAPAGIEAAQALSAQTPAPVAQPSPVQGLGLPGAGSKQLPQASTATLPKAKAPPTKIKKPKSGLSQAIKGVTSVRSKIKP